MSALKNGARQSSGTPDPGARHEIEEHKRAASDDFVTMTSVRSKSSRL